MRRLPLAVRIAAARAVTRPDASLGVLASRLADEGRRLDVLEAGDLSVRTTVQLGYQTIAADAADGHRHATRLLRLAATVD
ncbi:hypothetical protein ACTMS0_28065 [Micromonospora sp. H33]|uniref:hypothetical protein n=1 Tax=Micromonospora sp. H33 TaxID=3452215 RepID=UPI003F8A57F3